MAISSPIKIGIKSVTITSAQSGAIGADVEGTATIRLDTRTREAASGAMGVVGYKETHEPTYIELAIFDRGDLNLSGMMDLVDVSVTVVAKSGKIFTLSSGWLAASPEVNALEGTTTLRWESKRPVQEVTVAS